MPRENKMMRYNRKETWMNMQEIKRQQNPKEKIAIEPLLAEGRTVRIKPLGYSMYPLFVPERDEAVITPPAGKPLRRGDVVLYRRENGPLVLHRIWKCGKNGVYLTGDNQKDIEGPVKEEQILGILAAVIRNGHFFSVNHPVYRAMSGLWLCLRPFRPFLSHMAARFKKQGKRFKKIFVSKIMPFQK